RNPSAGCLVDAGVSIRNVEVTAEGPVDLYMAEPPRIIKRFSPPDCTAKGLPGYAHGSDAVHSITLPMRSYTPHEFGHEAVATGFGSLLPWSTTAHLESNLSPQGY